MGGLGKNALNVVLVSKYLGVLKVWGFRSGIDEAIFPLSLADDCNLRAEPSDNNVEKGIFVWRREYLCRNYFILTGN
jgi:hypothetical protein